MTNETRNELFEEFQELIPKIIRRNWPLIAALRLDTEDVEQDLAIRLWRQIDKFDPERSSSIRSYLFCSLQYEILNIKRRHKPYGITQIKNDERPQYIYLDRSQETGTVCELSCNDDTSDIELSEYLQCLTKSERETLTLKINGFTLKSNQHISNLLNARNKFAELYISERSA